MTEEKGNINRGRRAIDSELTFPVAVSRIAAWALGLGVGSVLGLLSYLCLEVQSQGKILIRMEERSQQAMEQAKQFSTEIERLRLTDARLSLELKDLQIEAARHGWKTGQ